MTPAGDIRCFSHFSHLFPMQMTMAAAAFSCWTGTGCNCVSQPFLAQAQGKNSACFPETAVIMVARQRFQMFESVQFHLQDHLGIVLKPSYLNFVCRSSLKHLKTCIAQVSRKAGPRFCAREIVVGYLNVSYGVSQKNVFLSLRGHSASNLYL